MVYTLMGLSALKEGQLTDAEAGIIDMTGKIMESVRIRVAKILLVFFMIYTFPFL